MPMYEYKCRVCEEIFEVEQSFTDDTLTTIDGCTIDVSGQHQVKKVFAAPAISFKGKGFYRNDSRSSNGGSSSSSSTAASSTGEPSSSSSDPSSGPSSSPSTSSDNGSSSSDAKTPSSTSAAD
ncbi:MAG: FmdB family transcriptional regulator [Acidimicrobiia bacterium]|nr:FmdB family transcriptional regulator [Acidimicrobiia bacterium]